MSKGTDPPAEEKKQRGDCRQRRCFSCQGHMPSRDSAVTVPPRKRQGRGPWEGWPGAVSLGSRGAAQEGGCKGARRCKDLEGGWGLETGQVSENSPGWKGLREIIWSNLLWEREPR